MDPLYAPDTPQDSIPQESEMDAAAKEKHARRFNRGLIWLGAGLLLLLSSFAVNFLLFHAGGDFSVAMYVLTSLGMVGILKGMGDILGF
ncbi:MAG: hypothetical protein SFV22_09180 [Saprospiraceae bacterium]|nr:hypothetical protein [Saprospiraceae bacterium]